MPDAAISEIPGAVVAAPAVLKNLVNVGARPVYVAGLSDPNLTMYLTVAIFHSFMKERGQ
jgi:hypothetical protein